MGQDLSERVVEILQASGANDYDQRSALGLACTRSESKKPIVRDSPVMGKRDDLADALLEAVDGYERGEVLDALACAREVINKPFLDPTMNGQQFKARIDKEDRR